MLLQVNALLMQHKVLQDENEKLTRALQTALDENTNMAEKALLVGANLNMNTILFLFLFF